MSHRVEDAEVLSFYRSWVVDAHAILREAITQLTGGEKGRLIAVADVIEMKLNGADRPDYRPLPIAPYPQIPELCDPDEVYRVTGIITEEQP